MYQFNYKYLLMLYCVEALYQTIFFFLTHGIICIWSQFLK